MKYANKIERPKCLNCGKPVKKHRIGCPQIDNEIC